jgi:hypothetical protein
MGQDELLDHLVQVLERLGINYLLVGAIASAAYGEPRFTRDLDVVADLHAEDLAGLSNYFPATDFYLDPHAAREAVARRTQFNIVHPASGLKIDVIVAANDPFDQSRFRRGRRLQALPHRQATFASPEDVIIKKMEYYRMGASEKHLRDITGILKVSGADIDRDYVSQWADRLGLSEIWQAIRRRLGEAISERRAT